MGHIIAAVNMKGGVGKTTLTVNLAACLAKNHNKRVLVVDLDTQINATLSLISPSEYTKIKRDKLTLKHLLDKVIKPEIKLNIPVNKIIVNNVCATRGLDLLPGDFELYDDAIVTEVICKQYRETVNDNVDNILHEFEYKLLSGIVQTLVPAYDFIILDCAPGYDLITRSAILISDFYLMPARPEPLSAIGINLLERRLRKLKEKHKSEIQLLGIIFTLPGHSAKLHPKVISKVTEDFGYDKVFRTTIPHNVDVAEAVDKFKPVILTSPSAEGAKAYIKLTTEFLQKLAKSLGVEKKEKDSTYDLFNQL